MQNKKWIFRIPTGHIYGPFEKARVAELLAKGILTGEEDVAEYPAGDWKKFSQEGELSEVLMQLLSRGGATSERNVSKEEEASVKTRGRVQSRKLHGSEPPKTLKPLSYSSPPDIMLSDEKKLKAKTNFIPLIIVALALVIGFVGWKQKSKSDIKSISLLSPLPKAHGDPSKAQEYIRQGWTYFYKDTFTDYIKAEESFLKAVEESPSNADALIMLLMTDNELWPFVKQDSQDRLVVQWLLQAVSKVDVYGPRRALGAAIAKTVLNDEGAKTQIDSGLLEQPTEGRFYALKAQNYFSNSEFEQSRNYYEKTATLMPHWVKTYYMQGVNSSRLGMGSQAEKALRAALKINPNHMGSRLELGIVEEVFFNHTDMAKENLIVAFDSKEKFLPSMESRGRAVLAQIYKKNGEDPKALKEAVRALELNPGDPFLRSMVSKFGGDATKVEGRAGDKQYIQQGEQYWHMKNFLAAQAQFKAALELNPKNAIAALRAGEALWQMHQGAEALQYIQKATVLDPKLIAAHVRLSDYKTQRFEFDSAAKSLEVALKANPKNYEVLQAYALFYLRKGDYAQAETAIKKALDSYETDVYGNQLMARVQLGKKEVVKAMQFAKRAVELDSRNIEAQVTYGKIKRAYEGEKSAQTFFANLISTYPSILEYRLALGEIFIQAEQFPSARQILEQVIAFDNNNKEAYLLLGDAFFLNNQLEQALSAYMSAARVDPSDPGGIFRAGEVYLKNGKYFEAQKQFQLVIRVNSLFPRAHYNLAKALFKSGMGDLALKELSEEKRINPRLADPYELAGDIQLSLRKYALATQEYQKFAELRPQGASIYVKQAKAYRGQGAFDAALAMLRLAAAKESGFSEIYREQGYIFDQKGSPEEAVANFKKYLRLEPNPTDKAQILDKIKELE